MTAAKKEALGGVTCANTNKEALIKVPAGDGPYVRAKHAQVKIDSA
jgi:hypothetical protein